jgi:hypothetical protein
VQNGSHTQRLTSRAWSRDLGYPDCERCGAKKIGYYSARCNRAGHVIEVVCGDCNDAENLATWDANKRLTSSLTVSAAMKSWGRKIRVRFLGGFEPPHPWETPLEFDGDEHRWTMPVIYSPRDPDFGGFVMMTAKPKNSQEMREFKSGRVFHLYDDGRRVAHGVVEPWDMRWLDIAEQSEGIHALAKSPTGFEQTVWFGGLQKAVLDTNDRSLGAKFTAKDGTTIEMLTYCCAGRCVIQLDAPDARLTLITAEDETEPRMGVQGIDATVDQAQGLLIAATEAWREGRVTLSTANASMGF